MRSKNKPNHRNTNGQEKQPHTVKVERQIFRFSRFALAIDYSKVSIIHACADFGAREREKMPVRQTTGQDGIADTSSY